MGFNGVINVYKEKGYTSNDVVAIVKRTLKSKAGHTGTLDPDACGVLPVCLGRSTKLADLLTSQEKKYRAVMHLGYKTDTLDMSGEILSMHKVSLSEEEIREAVLSFQGKIKQIPPMYSAIKINGEKLYDLARQGIEIERKARDIEIFSIEISEINLEKHTVTMDIHCSKGTYIRSLCADIGDKLKVGAAMGELLRLSSGKFSLDTAVKLDKIKELVQTDEIEKIIISPEEILGDYEKITVCEMADKFIKNGNVMNIALLEGRKDLVRGKNYLLYNYKSEFIGIYNYAGKDFLKPDLILIDLNQY